MPLYTAPDADAGIRKMVVYALGALPGDAQVDTLRTALEDPVADVRWNAAMALARHGSTDGVPVLRQMLDRQLRGAGASSATCGRTTIRIRSRT